MKKNDMSLKKSNVMSGLLAGDPEKPFEPGISDDPGLLQSQ